MESADQHINPYAAPMAAVAVPAEARPQVLASRALRLAAVIVDNLMVSVLLLPGYLLLLEEGPADWGTFLVRAAWVGTPLGVILVGTNLFLLVRDGQTLAKRWFGLRVVRADGSRCGAARLLGLRYVMPAVISAIPCVGSLFSLIDALMIFREERRCIHDDMADTIVVMT